MVRTPAATFAFGIAAVLFVLEGRRYANLRLVLREIERRQGDLAHSDLVQLVGQATGAPVPPTLSPEEWLDHERQRSRVKLAGILTIGAITIAAVFVIQLRLPEPDLEVDPPTRVDVRAAYPPDHTAEQRLRSTPYAAVPLVVRSRQQPAKRATVDGSTLRLSAGTDVIDLEWDSFVNMYPERYNTWFGQDGSVQPFTIEPGSTVAREVLYRGLNGVTWKDILDIFSQDRHDQLNVVLRVKIDNRWFDRQCTSIDAEVRRAEVSRMMAENRTASRITMDCK